jgi:DNA polymerase-3 subunit delta
MDLRLNQLDAHLERTLAPLYVIHGDEPLFAIEAGDAIRAAARRAGCEEREVLVADTGFRWEALLAANANLGLFGARKMVDLRIPSGKPGADGAKALETCARAPNPDHIMLITLPKLERAAQQSAWFAALGATGIVITVYPLDRAELPTWIAARLSRARQRAGPETLAFLADRCEGNLLAARQEIEKLALILPEGLLAHDAVERAVADVARYDVFELSAACLSGDAARALKIIAALEAEGEGLPLLLWQIGEDIHALAAVQEATAGGTPLTTAVRNARVWGKRQAALERAARRVKPDAIAPMVRALATLDAVAKGIGRGNAWDDLRTLVLTLAGKQALRPT